MIYLLAFLMNVCNGLFLLSTPLVAIKELHASVLVLGLLGTAGAAVYALSCAMSGVLADRFGKETMLPLGCCILILADCSILWVSRIPHLFLLVAAASFGAAMFWPSLMKWVGEKGDHKGLGKRVGAFNISWSAGIMVGPFIGGRLYTMDYRCPYILGAFIVLCVLLLLLRFRKRLGREIICPEEPAVQKPGGDAKGFIYIAWLANFSIWFTIGATENLFPKLADSLGISAGSLGGMISLVGLGQMLTFFFLFFFFSHSTWWHFKIRPLIMVQAGCAAGAAFFLLSSAPSLFRLGFLAIGLAGGVTYFSSLFYSLYHRESQGVKSGFHEAILAVGIGLGPLAGGVAATFRGLRAPYAVCLLLILLTVILETILYFSSPRRARRTRRNKK